MSGSIRKRQTTPKDQHASKKDINSDALVDSGFEEEMDRGRSAESKVKKDTAPPDSTEETPDGSSAENKIHGKEFHSGNSDEKSADRSTYHGEEALLNRPTYSSFFYASLLVITILSFITRFYKISNGSTVMYG